MADFFDARVGGYDDHMRANVEAFEAFYDAIGAACPRTDAPIEVLDLGIGTGLELGPLFARAPGARVTGIDVSAGMLARLRAKHADRIDQLRLVQASFLDVDLGRGAYDLVVSSMALHHWLSAEKLALYRRIFDALRLGGRFVNGDYVRSDDDPLPTCPGASDEPTTRLVHVDRPLSVDEEQRLLRESGFALVRVAFATARSAVLVANRADG